MTVRTRPLEEGPEYFWERFSAYAQSFPVSPEPVGSPLIEVVTPLGPLYAFDRGLAPFSGGETPLILHGQVELWEEVQGQREAVRRLEGGRYAFSGQVEAVLEPPFFVLRVLGPEGQAGFRLVLAALEPPPAGGWVVVRLRPPLMAFRPEVLGR
ncbi:hypothetical protein Mlute_00918 [Meiothermus luteus]|jgi:hypothetical protein|uniref:Uncharacterized protein n=1 Tax=Meiothermus luteus TaxID=2026184 RepID=A0A399EUB1_9DEIN|nr:hypothetical protein [Meiothermus luteus]RIH87608.1 hypothetical protein Mlute_00918 [Meiothermus luteus]